jgi:hypothetical protein
MKRYSIIVREVGSGHEVELLQVDRNPNPIVFALGQKTRSQGDYTARYDWVRIIDHGPSDDAVVADDALPLWEDAWK